MCSDSASAEATPSRTSGACARTLAGEVSRPSVPSRARASAGTFFGSWSRSWALRMAPKTVTPMAPPSERKKFAAAVATPSWRISTEFCTAAMSTWVTRPKPIPKTARKPPAATWEESALRVDIRYRPSDMISRPAIGNSLYLPVAATTLPETVRLTTVAIISGTSSSPDSVAVSPLATWRKSGV